MKTSLNVLLGVTLLLGSCANSDVKERGGGSHASNSIEKSQRTQVSVADVDEFDEEIESLLFSLPDSVPYKEHEDFFQESNEKGSDKIERETLVGKQDQELKDLSESSDPINKALALCELKEFDKGLDWLDKNYHSFKKHPPFWNAMGTCYLQKGEMRKSLLYYNRAIEMNQQYAPAWNNLGVINLQEKKDQTALLAFERALQLNKFSQTPNYNLAFLYLQYGFVDKAEKYFSTLLKSSPNDLELKIGWSITQVILGKPDQALSVFEKLPRSRRESPDVGIYYSLGLALKNRKGDAEDIWEDIEINRDKRYSELYQRVGRFIRGNNG